MGGERELVTAAAAAAAVTVGLLEVVMAVTWVAAGIRVLRHCNSVGKSARGERWLLVRSMAQSLEHMDNRSSRRISICTQSKTGRPSTLSDSMGVTEVVEMAA